MKHIELTFNYSKDQYEKKIYILTKHEQNKITDYVLNNLTTRNIGILISLYSGIRIGELCALKWEDINLERKTLSVRKQITDRCGTSRNSNSWCQKPKIV